MCYFSEYETQTTNNKMSRRKHRTLKEEQIADNVKIGDILGVECSNMSGVFKFYKVMRVNLKTYKLMVLEQEIINIDDETEEVRATEVIKQGVLYNYGKNKGLLTNKEMVAKEDVNRVSFIRKVEPERYR